MAILHYLNVGDGDCTIIQHDSGRVSMIDVNKARILTDEARLRESFKIAMGGNFQQKHDPTNAIEYMRERGIHEIFRFVLTHPDMDHMDGIKDIFAKFQPPNFWDTANNCEKEERGWGRYRKEDWDFYKQLRAGKGAIRLVHHSGEERREFWDDDGIYVLAPTPDLVTRANSAGEWNDASYVLAIIITNPHRPDRPWTVVVTGDSHDGTWEHILETYPTQLQDIDLLLAPHHGRHSDADHKFLSTLRPKLTLFGNAPSEHMAYGAWSSRDLRVITNNQAADIVVDFTVDLGAVFSTNQAYAASKIVDPWYNQTHKAWLCTVIRSS